MPHVSRYKLTKKAESELIKELNLVLTSIQKEQEMSDFISSLLSPTEKLMLAKRLAIIVMLEEDVPDTHIASAIHVTRSTITKIRYFYEARGTGYKIALKKLKTNKQYDQFKKFLISLAQSSLRTTSK